MSLRRATAILLLGLSAASAVSAQTLDVNINDKSASFSYFAPMGQRAMGRSEFEASLLFNEDDDVIGGVGMRVMGATGSRSPGLRAGVGVKGYALKADDADVVAITLGGMFDYAAPALPRLHVGGHINFAPDIITFVDGERYYEAGARMGYELMRDVTAYIGYRKIKVDLKKAPDVTADEGGHLGIRFDF